MNQRHRPGALRLFCLIAFLVLSSLVRRGESDTAWPTTPGTHESVDISGQQGRCCSRQIVRDWKKRRPEFFMA
jgi:hypothetical protein